MWISLKAFARGIVRHWYQSLGGTGMAVIALIADMRNWDLSPRILMGLSAGLFMWAIVRAFHDLRVERDTAQSALSDSRNLQRIADRLTQEYQAGVDYLDTLSAVSDKDWTKFNEQIAAWEKGVESILEEEHASLQEINHFKTIPMVEWYDEHGESQDILERLLRIRIQRLADISTQYATRAEEVRRHTMQRQAR